MPIAKERRNGLSLRILFLSLYEPIYLFLLLLIPDKTALFASFLSAFLVYILPNLQSNPGDLTVELLMHISLQLQNGSTPAYEQKTFEAQQGDILANALFVGSLAFLLVTAFLSVLVKGWIRDFDRDLPPITVVEERARERERRMRSLIHWRLPQLVALLPALTQIALVLFCAGLITFLRDIHSLIANVTAGCLGAGLLIYMTTTMISMYDPFSPFPSPISRKLSGVLPRMRGGIRHRWKTLHLAWNRTVPPTDHSYPLRTPVNTLFRRLKYFFSSEDEVAGTERETLVIKHARNLSVNLQIMNYLGDVTLVAPENIATFLAMIKQIGSYGQIRPTGCPRWLEVLATIHPVLYKTSDREIRQGLMRITAQSIKFDSADLLHRDIYLNMEQWLSEEKGSDLVMARLDSLASEIEYLIQVSTWGQACATIKEAKLVESLAIELLWFAKFVNSSLVSALDLNLRKRLVRDLTSNALTRSLTLAVILPPTDGLLIVNAALKAAPALLSSLQAIQPPSKTHRQAKLSRQGELFKLESVKGARDRIDLEQIVVILRSATKEKSALTRIPIFLFLALHTVDPLGTLYSSGDIEPLTNFLIDIDDQASVPERSMISHRYILQALIRKIERGRSWTTISQVIRTYDAKVCESTGLLDVTVLELVEMIIRWLIMDGVSDADRLPTQMRDDLNNLASSFHNPWLALHWNNEVGSSRRIETREQALVLSQIDWVGHPAYERIARRTMELYHSRPQPHLLEFLLRSSCFYTSFSALGILAVGHPVGSLSAPWISPPVPTETQLEYIRITLARLFGSSSYPRTASLDDWLLIGSFISVAWETFSQEWRNVFISTWRSYEWVQWIHSVSVQLQEKLGLPADGSTNLAQGSQQGPVQGANNELQDAASHLLPFVLQIVDGCEPPITAHEALSLRNFHILELPDAFGDAQSKARIMTSLSTHHAQP